MLYIGITTSMCLALSTCVLLISLMQSVDRVQFLNTPSLSLLFGFAAASGTGAIDIVHLASIHASLKSHKLNFNIVVLNLIWLLVLYVPRESSFISTRFFVLNLED